MSIVEHRIGSIEQTVHTYVEIDRHTDGFELRAGAVTLATAEKSSTGVFSDGRWTVEIQDTAPDSLDDTSSFYVTSESEALDALNDIGLLYLAVKKGYV